MLSVGIDLGTTYSCVARYKNDAVEIIPNDQGQRVTPSVVAFNDNERLVGEGAVNLAHRIPDKVVFDNKRMIGRGFEEPELQQEIKQWPFKIDRASDKPNKPVIKVQVGKEEKEYYPEEISAMVLAKMKEIAEGFTGEKVDGAVITVPAYFNDGQRSSTKDAGVIAGLNVLRIINEPTAAAIAYGLDKKNDKEQKVVIYDLGGGTFDISIMIIEGGVIEVKATTGDTHLGGRDFDNIVMRNLLNEFKKLHNVDASTNSRAVTRLRNAIERGKRVLSSSMQVTIEVDGFMNGIDFYYTLTRARFNEWCEPFFDKTLELLKTALMEAKMDKSSIDICVCVGGSTRIPRVKEKLAAFFGKDPTCTLNPDECVATGAAIQAAILSGDQSDAIKDILLLDVNPLSLGLETYGGMMSTIIPKNTTIPASKSQTYTTSADGQTSVEIKVYEGERALTRDNTLLGTFTVTGIPPGPRGGPQIEITFSITQESLLTVKAVEKKSGVKNHIEICKKTSGLSPEQMEKAMKDVEENREKDEQIRKSAAQRNELETHVYNLKGQKEQLKSKLAADKMALLESALQKATEILDSHTDFSVPFDYTTALAEFQKNSYEATKSIYDQPGAGAAGAGGFDPSGAAGAGGFDPSGAAGGFDPSAFSGAAAGGAGAASGAGAAGASGPIVEEVD